MLTPDGDPPHPRTLGAGGFCLPLTSSPSSIPLIPQLWTHRFPCSQVDTHLLAFACALPPASSSSLCLSSLRSQPTDPTFPPSCFFLVLLVFFLISLMATSDTPTCLFSVYLSRTSAPFRQGFLSRSPRCPQRTERGQTEEVLDQICKTNP